jgi:glycosyltransferase involved in cell wall biosynthesis
VKILIVTNLYPTPLDPNRSTFNRQQFQALAAEHSVRIIAPVAWTDELAARRRGSPPLPKDRVSQVDGIAVNHPRYWFPPRAMRGTYGRFFQWSIGRAFRRAVAEFKPDVVLASWAYPDGWAAVRLARLAGLPVVVKVHGSDVLHQAAHPARRRRTIEALLAADGVVAVGEDLAKHVTESGVEPARVRVVYNGIDTGLFTPGPKDAARAKLGIDPAQTALLYVGNLVPVKGVDLLIEACGLLKTDGPPFHLHLIGKGSDRPALEKRSAELGLQQFVTFHGPKPHSELPDWFRAADLLVLPSRSEGVPNVLLECSACGTPYVATNVGGVPEIAAFGDGTGVQAEDPKALADAIRRRLAIGNRASPSRPTRSHAVSAAELGAALQTAIDRHRSASTGIDRNRPESK